MAYSQGHFKMIAPILSAYFRCLLRDAIFQKLCFALLISMVFYEVWFRIYAHIDRTFILVFIYVNITCYDSFFPSLLQHFKNELSLYLLNPCPIKRLIMFKMYLAFALWSINLMLVIIFMLFLRHADVLLFLKESFLVLPWIISASLLASSAGLASKNNTWSTIVFNLIVMAILIVNYRISTLFGLCAFAMIGMILIIVSFYALINAVQMYEWS